MSSFRKVSRFGQGLEHVPALLNFGVQCEQEHQQISLGSFYCFSETKEFVSELFDALKTKSYLPNPPPVPVPAPVPAPVPSSQTTNLVSQPSPTEAKPTANNTSNHTTADAADKVQVKQEPKETSSKKPADNKVRFGCASAPDDSLPHAQIHQHQTIRIVTSLAGL